MLYSMQMQNIKPLISHGRLIQRLFRRTDVCPWFFKALEGFGHSKEHVGAESSPFSQAALSAEQYIPCFRSAKADRILEIASNGFWKLQAKTDLFHSMYKVPVGGTFYGGPSCLKDPCNLNFANTACARILLTQPHHSGKLLKPEDNIDNN